MAQDLVKDLGIKKTMVTVCSALMAAGVEAKVGAKAWETILTSMKPVEGSTATGPREVTILKDIDGNQLGRKCAISGLWFDISSFHKGTTCIKAIDTIKGLLYSESKKMEKDAKDLLEDARELTSPADKIAKYEAYDAKLLEAKEHRASDIEVTDEMKVGGFDSIEALAKNLDVEVNPVKPEEA